MLKLQVRPVMHVINYAVCNLAACVIGDVMTANKRESPGPPL